MVKRKKNNSNAVWYAKRQTLDAAAKATTESYHSVVAGLVEEQVDRMIPELTKRLTVQIIEHFKMYFRSSELVRTSDPATMHTFITNCVLAATFDVQDSAASAFDSSGKPTVLSCRQKFNEEFAVANENKETWCADTRSQLIVSRPNGSGNPKPTLVVPDVRKE
jgi:hypothetical protein